MSCSGIGGAIFAPIVNALIEGLGWRGAYVGVAVIGTILILPFTLFAIRGKPADKGLLPYGADCSSEISQEVAAEGISAKTAVKSSAFYMIAVFVVAVSAIAQVTTHVAGAIIDLGFDSSVGAVASSATQIGLTVAVILAGYISDRLGIAKALWINIILGIAGIIVMLIGSMKEVVMVGAALFGFVVALCSVAPPLVVRQAFGNLEYPKIYSYFTIVIQVVASVSIPLYGFIYDATGTYKSVFYLIIALAVIAGTLAVAALKKSEKLEGEKITV